MNTSENHSLGTFLKLEREKRNITLEQVAYSTRISIKMLQALESDDHESLPAAPFVRGYLQSYAKFVELDTQDILLRYQHHIATLPVQNSHSSATNYIYSKEKSVEKKNVMIIVSILLFALVASGIFYFVRTNEKKDTAQDSKQATDIKKNILAKKTDPEKESPPDEENKEDNIKKLEQTVKIAATKIKDAKAEKVENIDIIATPAPVEDNDTDSKDENKKYTLRLTAKEDAWFRFQTDDDEVRDIMLRNGRTVTLHADKVFKLFSGNLGGIQAELNGEKLEKLVQEGRTMSAVLPFSEVPNYPLPLFPPEDSSDSNSQPAEQQ